jgi:hypothetical protein
MGNAITTPPVRLSYTNSLFTPRAMTAGQTPKYSVVLLFDKTNKEQMAALKTLHDLAKACHSEKWPDPAKAPRIPMIGHDKSPIKDADKAADSQGVPLIEKNPEYAGHFIIRASTTTKPILVDRQRQELLDKEVIYGGCYAKVNLNPYAYSGTENKGVTFGLNGVQFWSDGERFGGGRPKMEDMFEAGSADDPANYGDAAFPEADPF